MLRLVKRFEALTTVDNLVNYESGFRLFLFLRFLKGLAPDTRIAQHFADSVCNYLVILVQKSILRERDVRTTV